MASCIYPIFGNFREFAILDDFHRGPPMNRALSILFLVLPFALAAQNDTRQKGTQGLDLEDDSLAEAMKQTGLGTPATRAAVT